MDWGNLIYEQAMGLVTAQATVLVPIGLKILGYVCLFRLLLMVSHMLLRHALDGAGGWHTSIHFSDVLILLFQVAMVTLVLNNYQALTALPNALVRSVVQTFDQNVVDQFLGLVSDTVAHVQQPNPWQILDVIVYIYVLVEMGLMSAIMFVVTSFAFVGYGVFIVIGPIFIPLAVTRRFSSWFWRWLEVLAGFLMYRVVAAAVAFVWGNMFIQFFSHGVGQDFSIANWIALLPVVLMLTLAFWYAMFKIPAMAALLFSGAGAIGQSYVNAAGSVIRAAAAS